MPKLFICRLVMEFYDVMNDFALVGVFMLWDRVL